MSAAIIGHRHSSKKCPSNQYHSDGRLSSTVFSKSTTDLPVSVSDLPPSVRRQEQLLLINAQTPVPRVVPPLVQVGSGLEKPIGYGAFGVVWSVVDPRDGRRLALKKIPNVFQNVIAAKRAFRELNFLYRLQHENVVSISSVLEEPNFPYEIYLLCDLMQTDLHKIIVSPQALSVDHVKIFLYQLLRGLKFLHSANILHRDVKPGNLLVNSDCKLKICDFGLARVDDPSSHSSRSLTLEVVTQYYRAPELLMGAQEYSAAIDIWSAGCIFAELLSRSILFQASSPLSQLDLILELLGTPDASDLGSACSAARRYVLRLPRRRPRLASVLWANSQTVTEDGLHLLQHLLKFNPKHRASSACALAHPYLEDARVRYHSCMCGCCSRSKSSRQRQQQRKEFEPEPACQTPMSGQLEESIGDMQQARCRLAEVAQRINAVDQRNASLPLRLNRDADNFNAFVRSSVAQANEIPPSPHRW